MGLDAVILVFWRLSLKPALSLSSMTLIKRLFSSSSLSAIRVVSSAYLRLLILLPATLIPAWDSSSLAFHMIYSAYSTCTQLNKQSDNIQPWHTPFPILNQSIVSCLVNCCFLTCRQVSQETGKVIWYSQFFKYFPQFVVIHTVKGFHLVNEAVVDVFLDFPCFLYDPTDAGNLIPGSSAFTKSRYIWKFLIHVLLKPSLKDFENYLASMWSE